MKPLRTRDDLLVLVAANAPTRAAQRTIEKQGALVVGGFNTTDGFSWIVDVTTGSKGFIIQIICDEQARKYRVKYLRPEEVPWVNWIGSSTGRRPLIDGDEPVLAAFKRMEAKRAAKKNGTISSGEVPAGEARHHRDPPSGDVVDEERAQE